MSIISLSTQTDQQPMIISNNEPRLLQLPAIQLLELFGAGKPNPGAGSAAAFEGILSCKLLRTAIMLTRTKSQYEKQTLQLNLVDKTVLDEIEPRLIDLFQKDAEQFPRVINARTSRDAATSPREKRRWIEKELIELKVSTEIPLSIARCGVTLAQHGLNVFDLGYKSVRGDSAVAISAANSATTGALAVVYLNLKKFGDEKWAVEQRNSANNLLKESESLRNELFRRISDLNTNVHQPSNIFMN